MIVSFSASLRTIDKDIDIYKKILSVIRTEGCSISNDWVESAWFYANNTSKSKLTRDWRFFNKQAETGIENADVSIIEGTGFSSFGVGYEAGYAIRIKKPTLILIKKQEIDTSYASGLSGDLMTVCGYTIDNLERNIQSFLRSYAIHSKDLRFNFVIDRQIYNHLRKKSFSSGKTKAEILRDLLIKDINNKNQ